MANFCYNNWKELCMEGDHDLSTATLKVLLVMSNTTADTDKTAATLANFTTLDECDATFYTRKTLANVTVTQDDTDDEGVLDADNVTWASIEDDASRQIVGAIIYEDVADAGVDSSALPICWIEDNMPFTTNGGQVVLSFAAEGIINTVDA